MEVLKDKNATLLQLLLWKNNVKVKKYIIIHKKPTAFIYLLNTSDFVNN